VRGYPDRTPILSNVRVNGDALRMRKFSAFVVSPLSGTRTGTHSAYRLTSSRRASLACILKKPTCSTLANLRRSRITASRSFLEVAPMPRINNCEYVREAEPNILLAIKISSRASGFSSPGLSRIPNFFNAAALALFNACSTKSRHSFSNSTYRESL
jgi:hypothetical protein